MEAELAAYEAQLRQELEGQPQEMAAD